MVQTITAFSDGTFSVNTGDDSSDLLDFVISTELQEKINQISSALSAVGGSEVHAEKDTFRQFEHLVVGGEVVGNDFGTTISEADFDWIINAVQSEKSAYLELIRQQQLAVLEAEEAEEAESASPEVI